MEARDLKRSIRLSLNLALGPGNPDYTNMAHSSRRRSRKRFPFTHFSVVFIGKLLFSFYQFSPHLARIMLFLGLHVMLILNWYT